MRLSLPLRAAGRMSTVEPGSRVAVAQAVGLLLDTRPGERRSVPGYGLPSALFSVGGVDPAQLVPVVQQWHPDADPLAVSVALSGTTQTVTVQPGVDDEAYV